VPLVPSGGATPSARANAQPVRIATTAGPGDASRVSGPEAPSCVVRGRCSLSASLPRGSNLRFAQGRPKSYGRSPIAGVFPSPRTHRDWGEPSAIAVSPKRPGQSRPPPPSSSLRRSSEVSNLRRTRCLPAQSSLDLRSRCSCERLEFLIVGYAGLRRCCRSEGIRTGRLQSAEAGCLCPPIQRVPVTGGLVRRRPARATEIVTRADSSCSV